MILQYLLPVMWFSIEMTLYFPLNDIRYNRYGEQTSLKKDGIVNSINVMLM